jgi:hypothetical protein
MKKMNAIEAVKQHKKEVRAQRAVLKNILEKYKDVINNAHKSRNLTFKSISVHHFNDKTDTYPIYKSPTYNGLQSSEYRLILVDGEPAYARKSNHWGRFSTNVKVKDALAEGFTQEDIDDADDFGRVGVKTYFWDLEGGDINKRTSQAGYILLRDLVGEVDI